MAEAVAYKNFRGYQGNQNLKRSNVGVEWTEDMVSEYLKCSEDPIYFIETRIQGFKSAQANGDVARYAHATQMRIRHGVFENVFWIGVVNFKLRVTMLRIPIDGIFCLRNIFNDEAMVRRKRALPFKKPGRYHLRPQQDSFSNLI